VAHGTPDYGVTAGALTRHQLFDVGELAARLGSPVTFDRRGDVVWWDDFECGLAKWITIVDGVGGSVALSTARARNGRSSALLTAGSTGTETAAIRHEGPFATLSRHGVEVSFNVGTPITSFTITYNLYDGTTLSQASVRWDDVAETLLYLDASVAYVIFASNIDLWQSVTLFHTAKLVVDAVNGRYVRFILDHLSFDLSGIPFSVSASALDPQVGQLITLVGRAGVNDQAYVDDVIVTENEPA
jgi:hypothetical protein